MLPQSTDLSNPRTRRDVLRTGVFALATGITTSTTGCLSGLPPLGQEQSYGRVDVPPAGDPGYRSWLPAPKTFDTVDSHYPVTYAKPSPIEGNEPEEFIGRRAISKTNLDYFGIGYENYNAYLHCAFGTVIEADFEISTVTEMVTQSGYNSDGSYRGYDVFSRSDVPRRLAVRDGTIVWASRVIHDHPSIEALIDTEAGDRRRYHETSQPFKRITDSIGASRMVLVGPNFGSLTERAELAAIGFRFAGDAVYQIINLLFPEGDVPTLDQFEREVRNVEEWTAEADVFDSELTDRLGSIETRVSRRSNSERSPFTDPPQVTWGVSHDSEAETVTFRHEAGETVDADLLWADITTETIPSVVKPLWDWDEQVSPGNSDTIDLSSADLSVDSETTHVEASPSSATANLSDSSERSKNDTKPTENGTVELSDVIRVDIVLAEHQAFTVGDSRRLFSYEVE